jgi:hypothetical protein
VIGRELIGVVGLRADGDEGDVVERSVVFVRVRNGMLSLVEDRLFRPSASRGVLGLSGEELLVPTLDLPENSC